MSRIGKLPVSIPDNVSVELSGNIVEIKGPKGSQIIDIPRGISVESKNNQVIVARVDDTKVNRSNHGLVRSLLQNAVTGVTDGFKKTLEVNGVGFKVSLSGSTINLSLGFSHQIQYKVPDDLKVGVEGNVITIEGYDKQRVGQVAAEIRSLKKPEPYKGKGIKYSDETIIRKAGKTAAAGGK
ncbi:50S ribosomal protein L6 [Candidatus Saccharibacteria bacterium CPR2]|nr:50S ribosomal protein L6 [Candidatus Saccharibacteria bacterium CPR2]